MIKKEVRLILNKEIGFGVHIPLIGCKVNLWDMEYIGFDEEAVKQHFKGFPWPETKKNQKDCTSRARVGVGQLELHFEGNACWIAKNPSHNFVLYLNKENKLMAFDADVSGTYKDLSGFMGKYKLGFRSEVV